MNATLLSCPYCNAEVPLAAGLPAGHKVVCPRCGEAFALTQPTADLDGSPDVAGPAASNAAAPLLPGAVRRAARPANRRLAALVVGVMVLMAGIGLTYALMTEDFRRKNDRGLVKKRHLRPGRPASELEPGPAIPPNPLSALGYLPSDTNVLVVARVSVLQGGAAGKKLLAGETKVGDEALSLSAVAKWAGLALKDVELLAVGARADDRLLPGVTVVVRTRERYDAERVIADLEARPRNVAGDARNGVHSFSLKGVPRGFRNALLWCADERTLVLRALVAPNMGDVPRQPVEDYKHLPSSVRDLIAPELAASPLWAVGEVSTWSKGWPKLVADQLQPEGIERLKLVRTFALSLRPERPARASLSLGGTGEAAARRLEGYFLALSKEAKGMTVTREGHAVELRWTGDLAEVGKALGK